MTDGPANSEAAPGVASFEIDRYSRLSVLEALEAPEATR